MRDFVLKSTKAITEMQTGLKHQQLCLVNFQLQLMCKKGLANFDFNSYCNSQPVHFLGLH